MTNITCINDIREAHQGTWFNQSTMDFFNTTLPDKSKIWRLGERVFFVSGEKENNPYYNTRRMYTIREFTVEDGGVETIGEFQQYRTPIEARTALEEMGAE